MRGGGRGGEGQGQIRGNGGGLTDGGGGEEAAADHRPDPVLDTVLEFVPDSVPDPVLSTEEDRSAEVGCLRRSSL